MTINRGDPAIWFVEIFLDASTLRACNAFENVSFDGNTYLGLGNGLIAPDDIERAADLKSQKFTVQFNSSKQTVDDDFVGILLDSQWRRRPVRVRYAVGIVGFDFSDPFIIIDEVGRIENLKDNIEPGYPALLDMDIESGALIFLERRNQTRSPANQKSAFAGDLFFDYAAKLDGVTLPWRTKFARSGTVKVTYDVKGVASREMLIGRGITKGSFVYAATHGQQRKYWSQVYALADHECASLDEIYINGENVLAGASALVHGVRTALSALSSGGTRLWVTWYDGRHDQTADAYLISETAGQNLAWTSAHRGRGVSYAIIEHLWDSDNPEAFSYEFVLSGATLYDERKDTTAGGSGAHRLDNPDTWEYSTNSEVALRHYLLGRVVSSTSSFKWFGVGADRTFLDEYGETEYRADQCDELETLKVTGSQKRYESNGWISSADDHAKNAYLLADAMVADVSDQGGRLIVRLAETQAPVVELLDEDLASDEPTDIDVNARSDDVLNAIEGRYLDALNKFSAVDYPTISNATFEEIDGDVIVGTWNQELEISEERAQRKATLYLNKKRRSTELEEVFGLKAKDVRPGDWLSRKSSVRGFPDGKSFIVDKVKRAIDGTVKLLMLEVDPNEVPWDRETAAQYNFSNEDHLIGLTPLAPPTVSGTPFTYSAAGVKIPGVQVGIDYGANQINAQTEYEVARNDGADAPDYAYEVITGIIAAGQTAYWLAGQLLPGVDYVIRARPILNERSGDWTDWEPFTAPSNFVSKSTLTAEPGSTLASTITAIQVFGANNAAAIIAEESARSSADSANAIRSAKLEAQVQRATSNLVPNGELANSAEGWSLSGFVAEVNWNGPRIRFDATGLPTALSPAFTVAPFTQMTIGATRLNSLRTTNPVFVNIVWYSSADGSGFPTYDAAADDVPNAADRLTITVTVPSYANSARVWIAAGGSDSGYVDITNVTCVQGANDVPNATPAGSLNQTRAAITTEASARASGDSANASLITTLEATVLSPNTNLVINGGFSTDPSIAGWAYAYADAVGPRITRTHTAEGVNLVTTYFVSVPGSTYTVSSELQSPGGNVSMQIVWTTAADAFIGFSSEFVSFTTGSWERKSQQFVAPATAEKGFIYFGSASITGLVEVRRLKAELGSTETPWSDEQSSARNGAKVEQIAEAYATDSASTARLVWTVATGTNVATFEQTAAEGYSDGTWNGSAISLTANEIILDGDVIVTGSLTTTQIAANAVTNTQAASTDGSIALTAHTWVTVQSKSITATGGDIMVAYNAVPYVTTTSTISPIVQARILRGATTVRTIHTTHFPSTNSDGSQQVGGAYSGFLIDSPSAGTYTYYLQLKGTTASGSGSLFSSTAEFRSLYLTEFKR